ncbi:conjugal transfer protein TrbC [Shewanella sp. SM72]|uniref:TrbC family F-type conjugative pilus assembly protein n=1 Tax=unclassified Shewanella TaxID=196818 RepID=UPI0021DA0A80|nr:MULTISPECIES: TrbC family F-type conjugative pilus assembly protein [unclassified Shewanella]MCU8000779.1 conjugal transfer protein TrbC [Shewanella sp. SM95]MCU8014057.1 conjugal transfer protein TrbC [Shewanella sp. SM74]MCU8019401.1 conjugal transfer protein TrbC [Shewanella sp. SM72]MCU8079824.1 conjugal transfer protein TrbC [Shewanella sp. SM103]
MHTSLSNKQSLVSAFAAITLSVINFNAVSADDNQQFILDAKRQMDEVRSQIEAMRQNNTQQPQGGLPAAWGQQSYISQAQMLTQQADAIRHQVLPKPEPVTPVVQQEIAANGEVFIFASFGMPAYTLKSALRAASQSQVKTTVVFRGLKDESESLRDASNAIHRAIDEADLDVTPRVIIDPRLFNTYAVEVAPTMVYRNGGKVVTATGLQSLEDFVKQSEGLLQSGSLGKLSDTYDITEMDMLELIQQKLKKVDWEEKKHEAVSRFVNRKEVQLTESLKDEDVRYKIDPRVRFTQDQTTPDGQYFAKAGDVVDPTALLQMETRLFMIDPTSERQLAWMNDVLSVTEHKQVYVLLSALPAGSDLTEFNQLQTKLGRRLYLMQPTMVSRFQLEHLPALVDLFKGEIRVTEIGQRTLSNAGLPTLLVAPNGGAK